MFVKVAALFRRIFKVNKIFLESTIGPVQKASHNAEIGWNPTGDAILTMKLILDRWGGKLTESGLTLNSDWRDIELNRTGAYYRFDCIL